jgi:hypothetical protein
MAATDQERVSWADQLSDEVRELEAKAGGFDPALSTRTVHLLRVIRGYETRVRQLALRGDHRLVGKL